MAELHDLLEKRKDKDPEVRGRVAVALGRFQDTDAFGALVDMLSDNDSRVRMAAARSLGDQGNPYAVEALLPLLEEGSTEMTCTVLAALAHLGGERAFAPVVCRLFDIDDEVRRNAAAAIGSLRDARAVEPLMMCLDDQDEWVRANSAISLGRIGDASAAEKLVEIADSQDTPLVRGNAVSGLAMLGIAAEDPDMASGTLEYVLSVMEDTGEDPKVRVAAMVAFGERFDAVLDKDPDLATEAFSDMRVLASVDEADDDVRSSAIWCLGRICSRGSVERTGLSTEAVVECAGIVAESLGKDEWSTRYAVEALSLMDVPGCRERIEEFSKSCGEEYAELCRVALESMG